MNSQHERSHGRPRKKRIPRGIRLALFTAALVAVFIGIFYIRAAVILGVGAPEYYDVSVNGIGLKGYSREEAQAMFDSLMTDWQNSSYTLTFEDRTWSFSPATFTASLDTDYQLALAWNIGHYGSLSSRCSAVLSLGDSPKAFTAKLAYDEAAVDAFVQEMYDALYVEAVDAVVVLDISEPRIVTESSDGRELDKEAAKAQIVSLLMGAGADTALPVYVVQPEVSTDSVSGQLEIVSYYSTSMKKSGYDRYLNVQLALNSFNAVAVYPGERISFNEVVGERTEARGFKKALEYAGNSVINGIGGGACQASTTLYCAVIMAGMDIIERHPHNMTVDYASPSMDATVSWGDKDFVFQNNTDHVFYIFTMVTRERAMVKIYGARPENKITLVSIVTEKGLKATKRINREDVSGTYVYYTDEEYLDSEGKEGCRSQSWLVYSDWETGEEISRVQITSDVYSPGTSIYYVGVHSRAIATPAPGTTY